MRLIDAEELIKGRVSNDPVVIAAQCAPTAYDVDVVVEQLLSESICTRKGEKAVVLLDRAIEIVKAGGVDGQHRKGERDEK